MNVLTTCRGTDDWLANKLTDERIAVHCLGWRINVDSSRPRDRMLLMTDTIGRFMSKHKS
jgi:hypothetical protein